MARVKLFGLVLIITSMLLAMAVIATDTYEIRLFRDSADAGGLADENSSTLSGAVPGSRPTDFKTGGPTGNPLPGPQFSTIPIVVPLGVSGGLGLLMWVAPGGTNSTKRSTVHYKRGTRRR